MKTLSYTFIFLLALCFAARGEQNADDIVAQLLDGTAAAPVSASVSVTSVAPAVAESALEEEESSAVESPAEELPKIPHTIPGQEVYDESAPPVAQTEKSDEPDVYTILPTNTVEEKVEEEINIEIPQTNFPPKKTVVKPGILAGRTTDYKGKPVQGVKVVLFSKGSYKEMQSTPGGNFGFSVTESNEYTLTAQYGNQFIHTNIYLLPGMNTLIPLHFSVPMTIYGRLYIDGKPAQYGLFLRLIGRHGGQAGGIVLSNGIFHIKNLTPGRYTMVFERRKRFIDRRLNETRFYYVPITLTSETARIYVERDKRRIFGNVIIDGLPRRNVDALVILKDAQTGGLLIHREAHTYYNQGYFCFENILPGTYILQAAQNQREWMSDKVVVTVKRSTKAKKVVIDVLPDPTAPARRLKNLRRQFLGE